MPNDETDGITEPQNDLSYVATSIADRWMQDRINPEPADTATDEQSSNTDDAPQPDLAALLREASPEEIRHLIIGPGLFVGSGGDVQAATRIWDGVIETVRSAFVHVEGEAAWGRFLEEEEAREEQAAVVETIRQGFLQALEDGGVEPQPVDGADLEKSGSASISATFEFDSGLDGPAPEVDAATDNGTGIDLGDGDGETVTVVVEGNPGVTVDPDKYFDGVPADLTELLRESAYNPGPGSIPIDLLDENGPTEPTERVVETPGDDREQPATSIFGAIDRELAEEAAGEQTRRVPVWVWPAVAAAVIAIAAFFAFGGDDDEPESSVGSGGAISPVTTATAPAHASAAVGGVATVAPTTRATATPPAARTPQAVQIPTLRICPDGSSFSGYEQPDGSFLDAETGEERVCPPPPS